MKLLITAFDPFNGESVNPAQEIITALPDKIATLSLIKLTIPTVFNECARVTRDAILLHKPDYVLNLGQAGGRFTISPERIAINIDDAGIPDNKGNQPIDQVICSDGEPAYFSKMPNKAIVARIKKSGIPASLSNSAGTFVCNHIMYRVHHMIDKEFPTIKAGFIHVPFLPSQVLNKPNTPSMNLSDMQRAIEIAIHTISEFHGKEDIVSLEGKTH